MRHRVRLTRQNPLTVCTLALLLLLGAGAGPVAEESTPPPRVIGSSSILFNPDILSSLGIEVVGATPTAEAYREGALGFAIEAPAQLLYSGALINTEGFSAGSLRHAGGFALAFAGLELSIHGFELRVGEAPYAFDLYDASGTRWFRLGSMQYELSPDGSELRLINTDLLLSPEFAKILGRTDLSNSYLAVIDVIIPSDLPQQSFPQAAAPRQTTGGSCDPPNPALDSDIALTALESLTQLAREPGGRVAIAPSAELMNVGVASIEWGQTITPDDVPGDIGPHPYLSLHFYRMLDGRLRQLGQSDLKHAFLSINSGCPCAAGHVIYPGCGDVYGSFLNGQHIHLGPREEVTASTGAWTRLGSHFDSCDAGMGANTPTLTDDVRSHGGPADHADSYEHRLVVREPDLQTAGAQYFVEGWYVVKDDVNLMNSLGHRRVAPSLTGETWSFPFTTSLTNGSILDTFVNPASPPAGAQNNFVDTGEGSFQLAVQTTTLPNGMVHYEYALMNFDFDRQVSSFSVPLANGVTVSNVQFNDIDTSAGNDWTPTTTPGTSIKWQAPAGNSLDWGTLYNFAFDANAPAIAANVTLTALEAGPAVAPVASLAPDPAGVPPGPGANDSCANAAVVGTGTLFGTLQNATNDGTSSEDGSPQPDVWYQFTPSRTGEVRINTCRSNDLPGVDLGIDTVLSVHSSCPGNLGNEIDANDDFDLGDDFTACDELDSQGNFLDDGMTLDSAVALTLTQGIPVLIRVTRLDTLNEFVLRILEPPPNDNFSNATPIASGTLAGTLDQAESDPDLGIGTPDVFYSFTPSSTGTVLVNTCGSFDATGTDTVLTLWELNTLGYLVENDDVDFGNDPTACNGPGGSFIDSAIAIERNSLAPLLIQVSQFDEGAGGDFILSVDGNPPFQVTIATDPAIIQMGGSADITWYAYQGGTCTALGSGWSGARAISGTQSVSPTVTTDYTLMCSESGAPGNTDSAVVTVTVASLVNDACGTPIVLSQAGLPFSDAIDTTIASSDVSDPNTATCPTGALAPDGATVWYSYSPKSSGPVTLSTIGSDYDTVLSVWNAAPGCGGLTQLAACNDNAAGTLQSELQLDAVFGTTYLIQVGDWEAGPGGRLVFSVPEPATGVMGLAALCALAGLRLRRRRYEREWRGQDLRASSRSSAESISRQ